MAVLPLETSTTVGRSFSSARRNGFLEFQERFLEEIAVAIVWLYGVSFMNKRFNQQIKPWLFKNSNHLNPETAWDPWILSKKNAINSVDLLPSQRFTRTAAEKTDLIKIKSVGLLLSVGAATATAALVIPWLNKKKTEWIISYLDQKESKNSQWQMLPPVTIHPGEPAHRTHQHAASLTQFNFSGPSPASQSLHQNFQNHHAGPFATAALSNNPMKFGFAGMGALQKAGHAIEQTNYGSMLAVDGGLAGGRVVVYGDRSPYEGAEIAVRDVGSLYFYMFSTPHIMLAASKALAPMLNADVMLEPMVGRRVQQNILARLLLDQPERSKKLSQTLKTALENNDARALSKALEDPAVQAELKQIRITPAEINDVITGNKTQIAKELQQQLQATWQQAEHGTFSKLLTVEADAYKVSHLLPAVQQQLAGKGTVTTDQLNQLLTDIGNGKTGAFAQFSANERSNLQTALKQAFRHTAGQSGSFEQLKRQALLSQVAKALPENERAGYWRRLEILARQDARDIANSSFRRSLNLAMTLSEEKLGNDARGFIDLGDTMSGWLEQAVAKQKNVGEAARDALNDFASDLQTFQKKGKLAHIQNLDTLLQQLRQGTPAETQQALTTLQTQLKDFKPNLWQRGKRGYLEQPSIQSQLDELVGILHPELHSGNTDALHAHLTPNNASTLDELANRNLESYTKTLNSLAKNTAALSANEQALLQRYTKDIYPLLSGSEQRLFSLFTSDATAQNTERLQALIAGGIQHDTQLIKEGLDTAGKLKAHSRLFNNPKAQEKMAGQIKAWSNSLAENLPKQAVTGDVLAKEAEAFRRLSQSGNLVARLTAAGISMLGLGVLIPKLQYGLTKKLTGKDEHPGLATLHHNDRHNVSWSHKKPSQSPLEALQA